MTAGQLLQLPLQDRSGDRSYLSLHQLTILPQPEIPSTGSMGNCIMAADSKCRPTNSQGGGSGVQAATMLCIHLLLSLDGMVNSRSYRIQKQAAACDVMFCVSVMVMDEGTGWWLRCAKVQLT